ncbi:hypothetical protein NL676_016414 [Syzygium grande]|nr:hypothetical protein NL676_016414 [Syzygium grande]
MGPPGSRLESFEMVDEEEEDPVGSGSLRTVSDTDSDQAVLIPTRQLGLSWTMKAQVSNRKYTYAGIDETNETTILKTTCPSAGSTKIREDQEFQLQTHEANVLFPR